MKRIASLRIWLAVLLVGAVLMPPALADGQKLRIGVQKYGTLIVLQARASLEQRLAPAGVAVEWIEFPGGPQLLEALAAGSLDFGTTGEAPPVFAQAAGAPLLYVAVEPPAPAGEAILVPKDSPIRTLADLKGKRIALNKGSNVHYLLVQALDKAGLQPNDIRSVYLAPADARAAFERGSVDAWVIWDPFLAAAQDATGARVLADGAGLVSNHQFYLASRAFAAGHADLLRAVLAELDTVDRWAAAHQPEVVQLLAPRTGIAPAAIDAALSRLAYGVRPLTPEIVAEQQRIADTFHHLGLIPTAITVRDAIWQDRTAAAGQ
jgi:sulfonate transport system substrate-binding protein